MKAYKKLLVFAMAMVMLVSTTSVFAANSAETEMELQAQETFNAAPVELRQAILADSELSVAATYAYMDLEAAPATLKEDILNARTKIIHSQGWTVNGSCYIKHADGTIENLPEFSYLFPGWDIPSWDNSSISLMSQSPSTSVQPMGTMQVDDYYNYTIPKYSDSVTTKLMARVRANTYEFLMVKVLSLVPSTCNIGISHNGISDGWKPRVPAGDEFHVYPVEGTYYDIRVSTYDTSGNGNFRIYH